MKYTLAITHFNRYEMLLESFTQVLEDERIGEVLILDDCSDIGTQHRVSLLEKLNPKIRVIVQVKNRGMSMNKRDAVSYAKNEWVILFDSDNIISKSYLDAIPGKLHNDIIYCPDFAAPHFDYTLLAGRVFSSSFKPDLSKMDESCCMNTCNYLLNKKSYLEVWQENASVRGIDTLWFAYLWMREGNMFFVVPGMQYLHRVHDGSEYMKHVGYNMEQAKHFKHLIEVL